MSRQRMLLGLAVLVVPLLLGAQCPITPGTGAPGAPTLQPVLVDPSGTHYFLGGLYPALGTAPQSFELDTPLRTSSGLQYFAFTTRYHVDDGTTLELSWKRSGGDPVAVRSIDGPCADPISAQAFSAMQETNALRWTGVSGPASFHDSVDQILETGTPLRFTPCNQVSEILDRGGLSLLTTVLLPARLASGGGQLAAVAKRIGGTVPSAELLLPMAIAPLSMAVVGDSVAWGQGIEETSKWYSLIHDRLAARLGPMAPPRVAAHSGAVLRVDSERDNHTSISIANATGCGTDATLDGEVPRDRPTIPCQIKSLSMLSCSVSAPASGVPTFTCPTPPGSTLAPAVFDLRPRWDFVLMNGCANDMHGGDVVMGLNGRETPIQVTNLANDFCDLRHSVPDLHQFLPNATIAVIGYHLLVSHNTEVHRSGCFPHPVVEAAIGGAAVVLSMLALELDTQAAAARSMAFRTASDLALSTSASQLATANGVGRVVFASLSDSWGQANATEASAPLNWGLHCVVASPPPFAPEDPVAAGRIPSCAAAHPSRSPSELVAEQNCRRASAFHPNTSGHAAIAAAVITALDAAGAIGP